MSSKRIVIAGGSGFIGGALAKAFSERGFEVVILPRSPRRHREGVKEVEWNGRDVGPWSSLLDGAEAVINLAGKSISCPHTPTNLQAIIASRVDSVKGLAAAVAQVKVAPRVWVQASAVGFYGDTGDVVCDEIAPSGSDVLAEVCRKWEGAFTAAELPRTRRVILRIGFVLGTNGGALPVLSRMTKLFLGGSAGNGRQYLSWIHISDLTDMFVAAVTDETFSGVYNAAGPEPVTNARFMRELRHALHRPWSPPAPAFAVKLGARLMGSNGSLALISQRCVPRRFLEAGFRFKFPNLESAFDNLFHK